MARIRTLKPEYWADEKLGPLDPLTRLVFLGLISQADDAGRLVDSVKMLDGLLFPYTSDTCHRSLDELSRKGVIHRGKTAGGQCVIQIVNWHHQKIDKPNLSAALDAICKPSENDRRNIDEGSPPHSSTGTYDQDQERSARARKAVGLEGLDDYTRRCVRGLYGGDGVTGTAEDVWKGHPDGERERFLTSAVLRWQAERHERFNSRLFRRILESVIAEGAEAPDLSHWEDDDGAHRA